MRILKSVLIIPVLVLQISVFGARSASAMPFSLAARGAELANFGGAYPIIEVQNRGAGVAAGIIGGMILGGIIASQAPRNYYEPYPPYPAYRPYPAGDAGIAYCMRRFKSYDPYSMTYLGYDGFRHSCP